MAAFHLTVVAKDLTISTTLTHLRSINNSVTHLFMLEVQKTLFLEQLDFSGRTIFLRTQ